MTATVLFLLSHWWDGQAATFMKPDVITNTFPSQEGSACCLHPPGAYKRHFFLMSELQALSALCSYSQSRGVLCLFQRGTTVSHQEHFPLAFPFASKVRGSQCPQHFLQPKMGICAWLPGEVFVSAVTPANYF